MELERKKGFTGRSRYMRTALGVVATDFAAKWLITIGGIGTIVSVVLVFVFLVGRAAPLFLPAYETQRRESAGPWSAEKTPLRVGVDEYQALCWALYDDGVVRTVRVDTGEVIDQQSVTDGAAITASSAGYEGDLVLGFANGSVRTGVIGFRTAFREKRDMPAAMQDLHPGEVAMEGTGLVQRTAQGQFRTQRLNVELSPPLEIAKRPIAKLAHFARVEKHEFTIVSLTANAELRFTQITKPLIGGPNVETFDLPWKDARLPEYLTVLGTGDNVLAAFRDGSAVRYDTRLPNKPQVAEEFSFLPDGPGTLTALELLVSRDTVVSGDAEGRISAWFRVPRAKTDPGPDAWRMQSVHHMPRSSAGVTSLGASGQSRLLAAGYDDGSVRLFNTTTAHQVLATELEEVLPVTNVRVSPKDDGLLALAGPRLFQASFERRHPEVTLASLFTAVHYEGYAGPMHIWQSSFAGVGPEMKLGLMPLVFGTLKATFYAMLFGVPLALLAAVYTSEFVHSRWRTKVKSCIELMASLPSVVLGFLAGIVFAPLVEGHIASVIACFFTVPAALIAGAQFWPLLPRDLQLRFAWTRILGIFAALSAGLLLAIATGPLFESVLFGGDFKAWLDGQHGSGFGMWCMLFMPLAALLSLLLVTFWGNPLLLRHREASHFRFALLNMLKVLCGTICTLLIAGGIAGVLTGLGLDPRGSLVDTYVQRNSLVVGFVMGFAIIPIIYTLAEDALSTVPQHLRSASLGCGATPWQTAVRIVIPTAMSGLFSAIMVGLGRAVGETMIVLMAGGNTPTFEWNIFSGFRTLSANIAVELPEAAQYGTHERTLYLAALVLFLMTFLVNTAAEMVRLRFRKRAYQL